MLKALWAKVRASLSRFLSSPPSPSDDWRDFVDRYATASVPDHGLRRQTERCLSCPIGHENCHADNTKYIAWKTESKVTHVNEDGSQWKYTAREGVTRVACVVVQGYVDVVTHAASVICDVLKNFKGIDEINFMRQQRAGLILSAENGSDRVVVMNKPMFDLRGIFPSWNDFIHAIEEETMNKPALEEFVVSDTTEENQGEKQDGV